MTQEKLNIRADKPKSSHANRTTLLIIGAILLVIFGAIIIFSLQTSSNKAANSVSPAQNVAKLPDLSDLPSNYEDKNVSRYLAKNSENDNSTLAAQLAEMKKEQALLKQQVLSASRNANQNANGAENAFAEKSSLFFPGNAPSPQQMQKASLASKANSKGAPTSAGGASAYENQNMQQQKVDFIKSTAKDKESIYDEHEMETPISPDEVQAGTLIPAALLTAVNTSLPGEIVARVTNNVYNSVTGQYLLIPQGSKLIGQYDSQVSYGQSRVLIVFTRIIRPDGTSILLNSAMGSDLFGQSGVKGSVDNHWGRVIGSAVLSTVLSVGAGAAASNSFGNSNNMYPSSQENAALGAASGISQTGQQLVSRGMNVQPTLIIPTGYQFNVIVNKDMILSAYRDFTDSVKSRHTK